jgi:hypothetical protein
MIVVGAPCDASAATRGATVAWSWQFDDGSGGSPPNVASPDFPAQADAETWIGEVWPELLDAGVLAVTLREGDREVYGPMSLQPPE